MEAVDSQIPDENTRRYDRQIRLWEKSGQEALGSSHIAVIGINPASSEALKNMILAGIHSFTIIDNRSLKKDGCGNFFLQSSETPESTKRGEANLKLLCELNPQVQGHFIDLDPVTVIHQKPSFFSAFSAVVVSMGLQLNEVFVTQLSAVLWELKVPLVVIDTSGFIGYFRLSFPEQTVIESHPDTFNDLRLERPIPGLVEWVNKIDFDAQEGHGNIPYVAILVHFLAKLQANGNNFPSTYQQKKEFKELIYRGKKSQDEENFDEAIAAVNSSVKIREVPAEILKMFDDPKCQTIDDDTSEFWILVHSLQLYYVNEGEGVHLPISGSIPDMKADTHRYIELQMLYKAQAEKDVEAILQHLKSISCKSPKVSKISREKVATFCKNAYNLHVSNVIPLHLEWEKPCSLDLSDLEDPESGLWMWLALRSRHYIATTANKLPSDDDKSMLLNAMKEMLKNQNCSYELSPLACNFAEQLVSNTQELATTGSIIGGLVSQELTKLFTQQYVPSLPTCIFNGFSATTTSVKLSPLP